MPWRRIAVGLAGALCAFLAWSVIVALTLWKPTGYADHPQLGRIDQPGIYVHGTEGYSWSRLNSLGMRSPEVTTKRPGEKRILFLGDSFTEALQVPTADTFANRTVAELGNRTGTVTGVNTGRNGISPAAYIHLADYYLSTFKPDAVVIQLAGQDFYSDLENPNRNFYLRKTADGYRSVFNTDFASANPIVQQHPWVGILLEDPVIRLGTDTLTKAFRGSPADTPVGIQEAEYDPAVVDWTMTQLAERYPGAVVLFVPEVDYFGDPLRPSALEVAIETEARREGLTFVNPRQAFADEYAASRTVSNGFNNTVPGSGHLNRTGHAIIAEQLATVLRERLGQ